MRGRASATILQKCRGARVGRVVFVLFFSGIFFPISLHGVEMKPQRPYDRKFSETKEEGGLYCGIDAALTLKTFPFNGEALNATTIQVLGRCHGKDNGSLMVFLYGDRRRRKKKRKLTALVALDHDVFDG